MPNVDHEVLALTTINLLDRLIFRLIEKGVISEEDHSAVVQETIDQVRNAGNPRAADVEALVRKMYPI